jgi:uncharacterized protein (TIGR02001 family)
MTQVWIKNLEQEIIRQEHLSWLDAEERARAERIATPSDRRGFIFGRVLLRQTLSTLFYRAPMDWHFRQSENGRVFLKDVPGIDFSISHSRTALGFAVSTEGRVGFDLESLEAWENAVEPDAFTRDELTTLGGLAPRERARSLARLWTKKEAYAKFTGNGLEGELSELPEPHSNDALSVRSGELELGGKRHLFSVVSGRLERALLVTTCLLCLLIRIPGLHSPAVVWADDHRPAKVAASDAKDESADDEDDSDDDDDDDDSDDSSTAGTTAKSNSNDITANVTLTSDYLLRGLTQTEHAPALQGGFDWNHPAGIYLGVWGSNVHFADSNATLETSFSGGYWHEFGELNASVGAEYSAYWADDGRNSWDFPLELEWRDFDFQFAYAPDWQGESLQDYYFLLGWKHELLYGIKLGLTAGYSIFSGSYSYPDYGDFRVSLSRQYLGVVWDVSGIFVSRSLPELNGESASSRLVISVSKEF